MLMLGGVGIAELEDATKAIQTKQPAVASARTLTQILWRGGGRRSIASLLPATSGKARVDRCPVAAAVATLENVFAIGCVIQVRLVVLEPQRRDLKPVAVASRVCPIGVRLKIKVTLR
jgi:hypothetical protein